MGAVLPTIRLKPERERSVVLRHPWVFSGAIDRVSARPADGAVVEVVDHRDAWLARGTWSGQSSIQARLWTWQPEEAIDDDLIWRRLARAIAGCAALLGRPDTTACRLVFSEADGLPGLIADRYGEFVVVQLLTVGAAARAAAIVAGLAELTGARGILERSEAEVRAREGLPAVARTLHGATPEGPVEVLEHGVRLLVDLTDGQKTGAYLDQRANRLRVAAYCAGAEVLSAFCYTGGFELQAARAGARAVTGIDSSGEALRAAARHWQINQAACPATWIEGNVFGELRRLRAEERRFDVIVLDPPKFVQQRAQLERGCRGYKDINLLAMQLLRPGGILATFSCSGLVPADLFQKVVFGAAVDARRDVQIIERLSQDTDHPVLLTFPESDYLKGLICRVW
jgi:23S rRNA (cytosine1962-C5)-methyltransferase